MFLYFLRKAIITQMSKEKVDRRQLVSSETNSSRIFQEHLTQMVMKSQKKM